MVERASPNEPPAKPEDALDVKEGVAVAEIGSEFVEIVLRRFTKINEVLAKVPKAARAMVFAKALLAVAGVANAEAPSQDALHSALNTAARMYMSEQVARGNEARDADAAQIEQQFQAFLDKIQPGVQFVREELFGKNPTPMQQRAIRFAFANIFVPFDNAITRQNLTKAEKFDERLGAVLGAPVDLTDVLDAEFAQMHPKTREEKTAVFERDGAPTPRLDDLNEDGTPKQMGIGLERFRQSRSPEYAEFTRALFQIYRSAKFRELRSIVEDKGQMFAFEILLHPRVATPEELAWAKEQAKLEQMLGLADPEVAYKGMQ